MLHFTLETAPDFATDDNRIAIIGAGHVGATTAYALMLGALCRELVLIDRVGALAEAEATDICHANTLARPARIWAGDYADAARARIAIVTAGAAQRDARQTRLDLLADSAVIVRACVRRLRDVGFDGIWLIVSNPVDLMTLLEQRESGLPAQRVLGSGTLLDSAFLQSVLAATLRVDPRSVDAYVLGEHGDSEVAAFSTAHIGGQTVQQFAGADTPLLHEAIQQVAREAVLSQ